MSHRSPLVTLAGLVLAFAIMFGVNLVATAQSGGAGAAPTVSPPTAVPQSSATEPSDDDSTLKASPTETESEKGSAFPAKVVYAGRTEDGSAAVAVAILGEKAAAYLCDGRNVESWLRGTVDEDEVTLTSKDGATLEAKLDGSALTGTVDTGDEKLKFEIRPAKAPAGLYRAKGSKTTIGWIVLPDGSQVGIQTTGEDTSKAPRLDPDQPEVTVNRDRLEAAPVSGDEEL